MSARTWTILATGGAGFVSSALLCQLVRKMEHLLTNIDKQIYSKNLKSLAFGKSAHLIDEMEASLHAVTLKGQK